MTGERKRLEKLIAQANPHASVQQCADAAEQIRELLATSGEIATRKARKRAPRKKASQ